MVGHELVLDLCEAQGAVVGRNPGVDIGTFLKKANMEDSGKLFSAPYANSKFKSSPKFLNQKAKQTAQSLNCTRSTQLSRATVTYSLISKRSTLLQFDFGNSAAEPDLHGEKLHQGEC